MQLSLRTVTAPLIVGLVAAGCQLTADQAFKDAIPDQEDLKIVMGENDAEEGTEEQALFSDCEECCVDDDGDYRDGELYKLTRSAIYHVNGSLGAVYLWLNYIVHLPFSDTVENGYIWGPWNNTDTDPLSRLEYRFVMVEKSDDTFDFSLEIRLINDDDGEWQEYVFGNVKPTDRPHKGIGTMEIDFDAVHELDSAHPSRHHGRVVYAFDVREVEPTLSEPNTVTVDFHDFWNESEDEDEPDVINAQYTYERYENLAGKFEFVAAGDITGPDEEPDGQDELLTVQSRWTESGEGVASASISGGSLDEMEVKSYTLTECWADADDLFYMTYDHAAVTYTNGLPPLEETGCGEAGHCPSF